jgi:hypothetical protein
MEANFARFVEASPWRFARTYVTSYPHEYTLAKWCGAEAFGEAIRCIEARGVEEPFLGTWRKYLHVGDRKYWHMGNPASDDPKDHPTLINRTWLDVSRYRPEAEALGYAGEDLERLVERWESLLKRARGG